MIEQRSRDQQSAYNVLQAHDFMILRSKRQWKGSNFINLSSKQRRNSSSVSPTTKTLAFYGGLSWLLIFRGSLFTPLIFLIPPLGYQIVTVGFKWIEDLGCENSSGSLWCHLYAVIQCLVFSLFVFVLFFFFCAYSKNFLFFRKLSELF